MKNVFTEMTLRPGDSIEFIVTASDPEDLTLEYGIEIRNESIKWQSLNSFEVKITAEHISRIFKICLYIKSSRDYHASHSYDDYVEFFYKVLPPR